MMAVIKLDSHCSHCPILRLDKVIAFSGSTAHCIQERFIGIGPGIKVHLS